MPTLPDTYRHWQDSARRAALGANAFANVREHYSVQRSADRLLEVYENV